MVKEYNKIVRDRIPEIITASNKTCTTVFNVSNVILVRIP